MRGGPTIKEFVNSLEIPLKHFAQIAVRDPRSTHALRNRVPPPHASASGTM